MKLILVCYLELKYKESFSIYEKQITATIGYVIFRIEFVCIQAYISMMYLDALIAADM